MSTETFRFQVGDLRCVAVNDGHISDISVPGFFANAPTDDLRQALQRHGIDSNKLATPCISLVVDTGTHRVLVDTGGGKGHPGYGKTFSSEIPVKPNLGRLMDGLAVEGIAPESIDIVILSHAHVDHVSGAADSAGIPAFPNARYFMARGEWEQFISQQIPDQDDEWDGWAGSIRFAQRACIAIQDRIELVNPEVEILPGVCLIPTPGHTANHCSIEFVSGSERLVCPMDTLGHPIHAEHPAWNPEGEQSLVSRRQILSRAEAGAWVHVFHFPFPGVGRMIPDRDCWRWQALGSNPGAG